MPRTAKKRGTDVIDLTGDDDQRGSQAKRPALAASQPSRLNSTSSLNHAPSYSTGIGGSSVYSSSPQSSWTGSSVRTGNAGVASSQSSQPLQSSQLGTQEPDYLDLTQDDDGPPTELYGSFGLSTPQIMLANA